MSHIPDARHVGWLTSRGRVVAWRAGWAVPVPRCGSGGVAARRPAGWRSWRRTTWARRTGRAPTRPPTARRRHVGRRQFGRPAWRGRLGLAGADMGPGQLAGADMGSRPTGGRRHVERRSGCRAPPVAGPVLERAAPRPYAAPARGGTGTDVVRRVRERSSGRRTPRAARGAPRPAAAWRDPGSTVRMLTITVRKSSTIWTLSRPSASGPSSQIDGDRDGRDGEADRRHRRAEREVEADLHPLARRGPHGGDRLGQQHQQGDHHADDGVGKPTASTASSIDGGLDLGQADHGDEGRRRAAPGW